MQFRTIAITAAAAMTLFVSSAFADDQGAVTGGVGGAAAGAVVGGPVGAVVGGVAGATLGGAATGPDHRVDARPCDTRTVHEEDSNGNSRTMQSTNCPD